MPDDQELPMTPPQPEEAPRFADGLVPEAPPGRRKLWVFVELVFVVMAVVMPRALSGGTPFLLVAGVYLPAGVVGMALATAAILVGFLTSYRSTGGCLKAASRKRCSPGPVSSDEGCLPALVRRTGTTCTLPI